MLTIKRIATADSIGFNIIAALHRALEWLGDHHETAVFNAAYRVVEKQAAIIGLAEDKVSDLEDSRVDLVAECMEARAVLIAKHRTAMAALDKELAARADAIDTKLAAAATALIAAHTGYETIHQEVMDTLGIEVHA